MNQQLPKTTSGWTAVPKGWHFGLIC